MTNRIAKYYLDPRVTEAPAKIVLTGFNCDDLREVEASTKRSERVRARKICRRYGRLMYKLGWRHASREREAQGEAGTLEAFALGSVFGLVLGLAVVGVWSAWTT